MRIETGYQKQRLGIDGVLDMDDRSKDTHRL